MIPNNPLSHAFCQFANPISIQVPDGSSLDSFAFLSPLQKTSSPVPHEIANPYDPPVGRSYFLTAPPDCRIHQFPQDVVVTEKHSGQSFLVLRSHLVCLHSSPIYLWALLTPHPSA